MLWKSAPHQDANSLLSVYCIQMDKDKIVVGVRDTTIVIYDRQTFEERRRLRGHTYGDLHCTILDQIVLPAEPHCHASRGRCYHGRQRLGAVSTVRRLQDCERLQRRLR